MFFFLGSSALRADAPELPALPDAAPAAAPGLPGLPPAAGADVSPAAQTPAQNQAQLQALLETEKLLNQGETDLDKAIAKVIQATGLHLGGDAVVQSEDFLALPSDPLGMYAGNLSRVNGEGGPNGTGAFVAAGTAPLPTQFNDNGATGAQRIWPTVGYFDLDITARPTQDISGEVVYRMEKVFGQFWGQGDLAGVRWFNLHGDTAVGFDLGDFYYQDTPLTFWLPQDEYAFEPELLAVKRQEGLDDAEIQGNSFPLQGGRMEGTLLLFDHLDLTLTGLGIRTAVANNVNTAMPFGAVFPYDQYIYGGTARFTGEHEKAFSLGFSYFQTQESKDTALVPTYWPQQYGGVAGSDFRWDLGSHVSLHGEGAYSEYTPDYGGGLYDGGAVSWTAGGAGNLILDLKFGRDKLTLDGLYVDPQFINYAAQTRDEDPAEDFTGFMPTGDNLLDPYNAGYGLPNQPNYFFSEYNNVIYATNQGPQNGLVLNNGKQPGGIYLAPSPLNLSLPEGYATPNREGLGADYHGGWFGVGDGFIQPRLYGGMYLEPEVDYWVPQGVGRTTFERGGLGGCLDFKNLGWIPLKLSAGVAVEDSQADTYIAYTSARVCYDADYEVVRDVHLMAGFEHVDMNGGQFWTTNGLTPDTAYEWQNYTYDDYVAGVKWDLSKAASVYVSYSFDQFNNVDYGQTGLLAVQPDLDIYSADTQTQEFEARMKVEF